MLKNILKKLQVNKLYINCKEYQTMSMVVKQIEIPGQCRYIFLDYNNSWLSVRSTNQAEKYIKYNRLEIVGTEIVGESYIVKVRKADSFL